MPYRSDNCIQICSAKNYLVFGLGSSVGGPQRAIGFFHAAFWSGLLSSILHCIDPYLSTVVGARRNSQPKAVETFLSFSKVSSRTGA